MAMPTELEAQDSPVREPAIRVRNAATAYCKGASGIIDTFTPAARIEKLRALVVLDLSDPAQQLQAAGQAEQQAIDAAWARMLTVPPANPTTAALRQQDRDTFASLSVGDKAAWIMNADVDRLDAIIEAGQERASVPAEIWGQAEERYAKLNFVRSTGLSADYARKPSAHDPLATGVDEDAVERAADEALRRHRARNEIVDGVKQALQGLTTMVALVCDLNVNAAFDLLTAPQKVEA
ncbi:MAG: hypothetical protein QHC67_02945 [Sphingobium sp.]|nr:hypothetical protein [Sphingobium sp.]